MVLKKANCVNHPTRIAMGICVITKKAICAECSTQYEGVNYSKEGLKILLEQRDNSSNKRGIDERAFEMAIAGLSPVFFYLLYLVYYYGFLTLINLSQIE